MISKLGFEASENKPHPFTEIKDPANYSGHKKEWHITGGKNNI